MRRYKSLTGCSGGDSDEPSLATCVTVCWSSPGRFPNIPGLTPRPESDVVFILLDEKGEVIIGREKRIRQGSFVAKIIEF